MWWSPTNKIPHGFESGSEVLASIQKALVKLKSDLRGAPLIEYRLLDERNRLIGSLLLNLLVGFDKDGKLALPK